MIRNKQLQHRILGVDEDRVRYVCHANGVVPCARAGVVSGRARAEWRRNPNTGRLEMRWQASGALLPSLRGSTTRPFGKRRVQSHSK